MKKLSLIISMLLLVSALFVGCENEVTSYEITKENATNSSELTANNVTSKQTTTSSITTSNNSKKESLKPTSSNSSKKESSQNVSSSYQDFMKSLSTTKAKSMTSKELKSHIEDISDEDLPDSLIYTEGKIEYLHEESEQFGWLQEIKIDILGELTAAEVQEYVLEHKNGSRYYEDRENWYFSYDKELDNLLATQKNAVGFYHHRTIKKVSGLCFMGGSVKMVFYEKEDGKYALRMKCRVSNPDLLVGTLEVQSDGSAKAK